MKSIRNIAFSVLLTLGAFSLVTYTSCNKDECKDVVCNNGGTCNETDGSCNCATGYEGATCDTKSVEKFIGTWAVSEDCDGDVNTYQVTITADPSNVSGVLVSNLGDYGCTLGGTIVFNGMVNQSTLSINDTKCDTKMNADGSISNGVLTISYTATYTGGSDNCTATLTK